MDKELAECLTRIQVKAMFIANYCSRSEVWQPTPTQIIELQNTVFKAITELETEVQCLGEL